MRKLGIAIACLVLAPALAAGAFQASRPQVEAVEPRACAPVTGCFDTPGLVDEAGDSMSGALRLQSGLVIEDGVIDFLSDAPGILGTSTEQPVDIVVNSEPALRFEPATGDAATPSLTAFGSLDMGSNAVLFNTVPLVSTVVGQLTFGDKQVCLADEPCSNTGTITRIDTGAGLVGGPILTDGTVAVDFGAVQARVASSCADGFALRAIAEDGSVSCAGISGAALAWGLSGNAGTSPATNFLGTTDGAPLELRVDGRTALRLLPAGVPNVVGGSGLNGASGQGGFVGGGNENDVGDWAVVGGGVRNEATHPYSSVLGGGQNTARAPSATVIGGDHNTAGGPYALAGGRDSVAEAAYTVALGRQAAANHRGSFVWADSKGFTFPSTNGDQFSVRATGGARVVSGISPAGVPTSGVQLLPGAGAWTTLSDRDAKDNVVLVDARSILDKLAALPIAFWNYKSQDASVRHVGPMAQDFHAAFGVGETPAGISTVDADGVALAGIQGLYGLAQEQEQRIAELEEQNAALEQRLAALEAALLR